MNLPRRSVLALAALALAFALGARGGAAQTPRAPERLHVIVLHTNDVHGQVQPRAVRAGGDGAPRTLGGLARVAGYVNAVRAEAAASGAAVLVVDGGDWYQGTPEGAVDGGLPFVRGLAAAGYDALCVGNHELDLGVANLERLVAESGVPAVCANVRAADGERVAWAAPYRVVERAGLRIALVGLLTPQTPEITHRDARALAFADPAGALAAVRAELEGAVDWVLPVTHLGVLADQALARAHPDLPLVVGGHSHTYLREGVRFESTLIVQAGSKASAVGRVDAWLDPATKRVVELRSRLVDLDAEPVPEHRNPAVEAICAALVEQSAARLAEVVGRLAAPLERARDPLASSNVGNLIADALRERMGAELGVHNRGGIRCDVDAGPVTLRELFELCPFANEVVAMTLTGAEVEALVRQSVEDTRHSGLELSGMVAVVTRGPDGAARLVRVEVAGKPIEPEREYRLATNSFLADGGDGYAMLAGGRERERDPALLREVLAERFAATEVLRAPEENRYRVLSRQ